MVVYSVSAGSSLSSTCFLCQAFICSANLVQVLMVTVKCLRLCVVGSKTWYYNILKPVGYHVPEETGQENKPVN